MLGSKVFGTCLFSFQQVERDKADLSAVLAQGVSPKKAEVTLQRWLVSKRPPHAHSYWHHHDVGLSAFLGDVGWFWGWGYHGSGVQGVVW